MNVCLTHAALAKPRASSSFSRTQRRGRTNATMTRRIQKQSSMTLVFSRRTASSFAAKKKKFAVRAHHGPDYVAEFTPDAAVAGGLLLAAATLGRYLNLGEAIDCSDLTTGCTTSGLIVDQRLALLLGIVATPLVLPYLGLAHLLPTGGFSLVEGTTRLAVSAVFIGIGNKIGGGSTSGHGLGGLGRLSKRSLANVVTFFVFGVLAATLGNTPDLLHVLTETGKGKAATAVNAIANTARATGAEKALYGKIVGSALAGYLVIALAAKKGIIQRGSQFAQLMKTFVNLATGALFGTGLVVSQMANPAKIITFLACTRETFDPSLALVLGTGVATLIVGFKLIKDQFVGPPLGNAFSEVDQTSTEIDQKLLVGGAIFGTGWGLGGLCFGPMLVNFGAALTNKSVSITSGVGLAFVCYWVGQQFADKLDGIFA